MRASAHASPAAVGKARGLLGSKPAAAVGIARGLHAGKFVYMLGWLVSVGPAARGWFPPFSFPRWPLFFFPPSRRKRWSAPCGRSETGEGQRGAPRRASAPWPPSKKSPCPGPPLHRARGLFLWGLAYPEPIAAPSLNRGPPVYAMLPTRPASWARRPQGRRLWRPVSSLAAPPRGPALQAATPQLTRPPQKKAPGKKTCVSPSLKGLRPCGAAILPGFLPWLPGGALAGRSASAPPAPRPGCFSSAVLPRGACRLAASMALQGATRGKGKKPRYCPPARPRFPAK